MSRVTVDFSDLREAYEFVNVGDEFACEAFLSLETGQIFWRSDDEGAFDEPPGDVEDREKYLPIPGKRELDLGKHRVLQFAAEYLPEACEEVRDMFSRSGAYRRFRYLLERENALDQWYEFEGQETDAALRRWCHRNDLSLKDEPA